MRGNLHVMSDIHGQCGHLGLFEFGVVRSSILRKKGGEDGKDIYIYTLAVDIHLKYSLWNATI